MLCLPGTAGGSSRSFYSMVVASSLLSFATFFPYRRWLFLGVFDMVDVHICILSQMGNGSETGVDIRRPVITLRMLAAPDGLLQCHHACLLAC